MNASELNNLVTWVVAAIVPIFVRWGMTSDQANSLAVQLGSLVPVAAAGLWAVYSHWNMKKVPETATVTK